LTVTDFTAEVLDVPECVTRTRILYLPFFEGAFHLREYAPDDRFVDFPLTQAFEVESLLCSVAVTVCAGAWGSEPVTVMLVPALALVGAAIESVLLWHSDEVAFVFGAETPANAMTATATARMPIVSAFIVLLRRPADRATDDDGRGATGDAAAAPGLSPWSSQQFSGAKQSEH
jgi:hypothetical protein